jgi:hypothetical protein
LVLEPWHFGVLAGLGMCYEVLGNDAAAAKANELALTANPHLYRIRKRLESLREQIRRNNI